jgi:hypothetical protein
VITDTRLIAVWWFVSAKRSPAHITVESIKNMPWMFRVF